jgi:NAD(P)-dependent dehydrogenase (short-subunit alcohol dehydrogenase family)
VARHTDRVDVLLANAGASWGEAFDSHPGDAFRKVLALNVQAVFECCQGFAPLLRRAADGGEPARIVVTGSIAGIGIGTLGAHATFGYSASKAAVLHLARNLALELGPQGILVNSIAPGFFPSKMASGEGVFSFAFYENGGRYG